MAVAPTMPGTRTGVGRLSTVAAIAQLALVVRGPRRGRCRRAGARASAPGPAATAIASTMPATRTGALRSSAVPSPSWPYSFCPHAQTLPSARTASVWLPPPATARISVSPKTCSTPEVLRVVADPEEAAVVAAPRAQRAVGEDRDRMECARRDRDDVAEAVQLLRRRVADAVVVELVGEVRAPRVDVAVGGERERMLVGAGDGGDARQSRDHARRRAEREHRVPELALRVVAPGEHGPVGAARDRVEPAERHRRDAREARDAHRHRARLVRAVAVRAVVVAPRPEPAVGPHREGRHESDREARHIGDRRERHGRRVIVAGAVAEVAVAALAPRPDRAVALARRGIEVARPRPRPRPRAPATRVGVERTANVPSPTAPCSLLPQAQTLPSPFSATEKEAAAGELDHAGQSRDEDRCGGTLPRLRGMAVAQLPVGIPAERPDAAVGLARERVIRARGDLDHVRHARDRRGQRAGCSRRSRPARPSCSRPSPRPCCRSAAPGCGSGPRRSSRRS